MHRDALAVFHRRKDDRWDVKGVSLYNHTSASGVCQDLMVMVKRVWSQNERAVIMSVAVTPHVFISSSAV
ncbi:hypothetical protein ACHAXM_000422 [Skeletonema potamos]